MSTVTHDAPTTPRAHTASGIGFALASAASFGMSGPLARGLLDAGWSPGAVVTVRVVLGAVVLLVPAALALRGRWGLLWRGWRLVLAYGVVAVAGTQLAYFSAVAHLEVGVALLIEFVAPVAVVGWLWLRHGERPGRATVVGGAVALTGLVLVLDLLAGGLSGSATGVAWALASMVCVAFYFILSAHEGSGLPPVVLATAGLVIGGTALASAAAVGVLPWQVSTLATTYAGHRVAWWMPLVTLGVVTAALSYLTGIAGVRRLGSRLASFVGLTEVLAALVFAWLLLGELPAARQLAGGLLIVTGVVLVKLGERGVTAGPGGG